jgi:hypothetical protein
MSRHRILFLIIAVVVLGNPARLSAADANEARITRLKKEAKISGRTAALNDLVRSGSTVETGAGSQAELRFGNGTLVRLAASTVLKITSGTRKMDLIRGAVLVRAPKNSGDAELVTADVNSNLAGTTSVLEFYPKAYTKLIVLEGTARMFMPRIMGESVLVNAGQLLMFQAKAVSTSLPNPVDIDLKRMMATSLLIQGFPPLGSESSIAEGMQNQKKQKSEGGLADTNLVIFGRGTLVSLVPPDAEQAKSTATPSPSPVKKSSSTRSPR